MSATTRIAAGAARSPRRRRGAFRPALALGLLAALGPAGADTAADPATGIATGPAADLATGSTALGIATGLDALRWQDDAALRAELADYARLGAGWLRTDLNWAAVQAEGPDGHDWSSMDRIVALAREQGLRVLPVVGFAPDWARTGPDGPLAPDAAEHFARFVTAAVERYRPEGVRAWEIWNEPNMDGFWPGEPDPAAYARLLWAAHDAIERSDPEALVISGGLASAPETDPEPPIDHYGAAAFLEALYAEGAGGAFDALGFHPYSHPLMPGDPEPWNGWRLMGGPIRDLMTAQGDETKPVWITEYGAPTNAEGGGVSEEEQAAMLVEAHRLAEDTPWIGPLFWYSYRDLGTDPADEEHWFGLVRRPGEPKPSYGAFRDLARDAPGDP